ncbi:isochorismatase [Rhodanobacter thiooxydans]|uniref:Isochorismatase n=1 Tax=Rhodanobacter thiooxydans TaxID=416169 RepID=A0A154QGK0_9GAMM|nr:isochorismatase family protein [Rhodanobacter thiooxydans]EIL99316.1 N-carbamoylsarcosine amidase [Rhodanobacter thiooxydans LCS2]KZC22782.1 isochorismatase [Rhodanobacter thiooxydans]MCW0202137.1 isochorismatase family protein [Rhodanobacter thiooxydans]
MALESHRLNPARRYALILVDLSVGFTDPLRSRLAFACDDVIAANQRLLAAFRERGDPVFYTTVAYDSPAQAYVFREKIPALNDLVAGSELVGIDARVAPRADEYVIVKHAASGFFGTDLAQRLRATGADGVVVSGLTTSGCVRATALDALQHDLRVLIPYEAVGDRDQDAHAANLRDLQIKYADVADLDACLALLGA